MTKSTQQRESNRRREQMKRAARKPRSWPLWLAIGVVGAAVQFLAGESDPITESLRGMTAVVDDQRVQTRTHAAHGLTATVGVRN